MRQTRTIASGWCFRLSTTFIDNEQKGASWLAVMPAAQAQAEVERQMARIRHSLRRLQLEDSTLAQYIEALALRSQ